MFQSCLGIEISDERLAMVYLQSGFGNKVRMKAQSVFDIDPEQNAEEKIDTLNALVSEFMEENRISDTDIYVGIPSALSIVRSITFPSAVRENVSGTLKYEMERFIPIPVEEIRFDHQVLSENRKNKTIEVLVVAVRKKEIRPFLRFCEFPGRKVSGLETGSTCRANCFAYYREPMPSNEELIHEIKNCGDSERKEKSLPSEIVGAYGLALKGLWKKIPVNINLLPPEMRKKPSRTSFYFMCILIAAVLLLTMTWAGSVVYRKHSAIKQMDARLKGFANEIKAYETVLAEHESMEKHIRFLNELQKKRVSIPEILSEISRVLPETAWITELSYSEGKGIRLHGYADSASDLIPLLENSPLFRDVRFMSAISKGSDGKEKFGIEMKTTDMGSQNK